MSIPLTSRGPRAHEAPARRPGVGGRFDDLDAARIAPGSRAALYRVTVTSVIFTPAMIS
jgi:hypothetical protein